MPAVIVIGPLFVASAVDFAFVDFVVDCATYFGILYSVCSAAVLQL